MSIKHQRAHLIRRLLREHRVRSQDELVALLGNHDVEVTQATLSRHLRELHIVRRATPDGPVYQEDTAALLRAELAEVVGREVLTVQHNGQLVVLHTLPGRASGVASWLDHLGWIEVLGTLAGDDTVFVAPGPGIETAHLAQRVREVVAQETP